MTAQSNQKLKLALSIGLNLLALVSYESRAESQLERDFRIAKISASRSKIYGTAILFKVDEARRELIYVTNEHIVRSICSDTSNSVSHSFESIALNMHFLLECHPVPYFHASIASQSFQHDLAIIRAPLPDSLSPDDVTILSDKLNLTQTKFLNSEISRNYKIIGIRQSNFGDFGALPLETLDMTNIKLSLFTTDNCPPLKLSYCYRLPIVSWGFSGSPLFEVNAEGQPGPIFGISSYFDPLQPNTYIIPWEFLANWVTNALQIAPADQVAGSADDWFKSSQSHYEVNVLKGPLTGKKLVQRRSVGSDDSRLAKSAAGGGESQGGGGESQGGGGDKDLKTELWSRNGAIKEQLVFHDVNLETIIASMKAPNLWGLDRNNAITRILLGHPALPGLVGFFNFIPGVQFTDHSQPIEQWSGRHVYDLKQFINLYKKNPNYAGPTLKTTNSIFPNAPKKVSWWYSTSLLLVHIPKVNWPTQNSPHPLITTEEENLGQIKNVLSIDVSKYRSSTIKLETNSGIVELELKLPLQEGLGYENFNYTGEVKFKNESSFDGIRTGTCHGRGNLRSENEGSTWNFKIFYVCPIIDLKPDDSANKFRLRALSIVF